jgi:hypothetical protein
MIDEHSANTYKASPCQEINISSNEKNVLSPFLTTDCLSRCQRSQLRFVIGADSTPNTYRGSPFL